MPINTTATLIVPSSTIKSITGADASGTGGTNQAITYWFNSSSPANSLAFTAVSGIVSVWRTDLRTTTALTGATRLGYFRQVLSRLNRAIDSTITDLSFVVQGSTGYLIVAASLGNIWVYAIDLTNISSLSSLDGEAEISVSGNTLPANLSIGSTSLDLNLARTLPTNQRFTLQESSTLYQISAQSSINLGSGAFSSGVSGAPRGIIYLAGSGGRPDRLYIVNFSTNNISIIDPSTNQFETSAANTGGTGIISTATGSFSQPQGIAYVPASGSRPERFYITNTANNTISIISPNTNQLETTATNTGGTGIISATTGSFSAPRGITYVPASGGRPERLYIINGGNATISIISPDTNQRDTSAANTSATGVIPSSVVRSNSNGITYVPASGGRPDRLYATELNTFNGVYIISPDTNQLESTAANTTGGLFVNSNISVGQPRWLFYVPASGSRPEGLYINNNSDSTISIIDPTTNQLRSTAPNTTNGVVASTTSGLSGPQGGTHVPATATRLERFYIVNDNNTASPIFAVTNQLISGTVIRITFDRVDTSGGNGLSASTSSITPVICNGSNFYTARMRLTGSSTTRLLLDTVNNFLISRNSTNFFLYRNINFSSFNGTSNVTVNSVSIPPTTSTVGYYNISAAATLTATTTNAAFFYKATNAYLFGCLGTHQFVLYRFNADTVSGTVTPTTAATFSSNTISSSSLIRDVAVTNIGSDIILFAVGTSINLLYRFVNTTYDSTSNTAVAGSSARIVFNHGNATIAGRSASIYHNSSTGETLLTAVNSVDTSIYEITLSAFNGTNPAIIKGISINPSSNQYTLRPFHSNIRILGLATLEASNYSSSIPTHSSIATLTGVINFSNFNRASTEVVTLIERFTSAPSLTKSSNTNPITLSTEIDSYQALAILGIAANFPSAVTDFYSNSEYYPWNYLTTDDTAGTLSDSFTFSGATAGIVGNYRITVDSGTVTLGTKGTYNDSFTLQSGTTLALVADATLSTEFILNSGVSVVRATGATGSYTLTIPYANPGLSVGANITIASPPPLIVTNLVVGSRVKVTRVDTGAFLQQLQATTSTITFTFAYTGTVRVEARSATNSPAYKPWVTQVTISGTTVTIPALQEID